MEECGFSVSRGRRQIPPCAKETSMRQLVPKRQPAGWLVGAILIALVTVPCARSQPAPAAADPVEELRRALPMTSGDLTNPTPIVLEFRKKTLTQKVDALRTVAEMRRGLALEEWRESAGGDEKLRDIDAGLRRELGTRLTRAIDSMVESKDANSRLAAAVL